MNIYLKQEYMMRNYNSKIILLLVGVIYTIITLGINGKVSDENFFPYGGYQSQYNNTSITAVAVYNSTPSIQITWSNDISVSSNGGGTVNPWLEQWLLRSSSRNGYDTVLYSLNIADSIFIDTSVLIGIPYYYKLIRIEHRTINSLTVTTDTVSLTSVNIDKKIISKKISFYPNPTTGIIYVESAVSIERTEVFNLQGVLLISNQSSRYNVKGPLRQRDVSRHPAALQNDGLEQVNLSNQPKGIYFVKVHLKNGVVLTEKIVKD